MERLAAPVALVAEIDLNIRIQEGEVAQAVVEGAVRKFRFGKDFRVGLKGCFRPVLFRFDSLGDRGERNAALVFLIVLASVAADFHVAPFGEEVDDRNADAVQPAGRLIRALIELAAELQLGHNAFEGRDAQIRVNPDRDAAAVVLDGNGAVGVNRNGNLRRESGERFVERVVDDFVDQVMQALRGDVANVHRRAFAHVFEVGKGFQVGLDVFVFRLAFVAKAVVENFKFEFLLRRRRSFGRLIPLVFVHRLFGRVFRFRVRIRLVF